MLRKFGAGGVTGIGLSMLNFDFSDSDGLLAALLFILTPVSLLRFFTNHCRDRTLSLLLSLPIDGPPPWNLLQGAFNLGRRCSDQVCWRLLCFSYFNVGQQLNALYFKDLIIY